jgi:hypothetical protein
MRSREFPPLDPAGLISRQELITGGWSLSAIRHALSTGRLVRLRAGMYAAASHSPVQFDFGRAALLQQGLAVLRVCPRAVLSHATAGVAWGLPIVHQPAWPCITVPAGTALRELPRAHLHRAPLTWTRVQLVGGGRCTDVARTVVDIAREQGRDTGLAAADAALRLRLTTPDRLTAAARSCAGWPGIVRARDVLLRADPRAESPLESVSRLRLADFGLPTPHLQSEIVTLAGDFVARVDFYWPQYGVVGEADGDEKIRDRADLLDERRRQRVLENLGLTVVRWGWTDLAQFERLAYQLRMAFDRGIGAGGGQRWGVKPVDPLTHPQVSRPGGIQRHSGVHERVDRRLPG